VGLPLGSTSVFFSRWQKGVRPDMRRDKLKKIADAFGASMNWLASGDGEPPELDAATSLSSAVGDVPPAPSRWVEPTPRYMNLEVAIKRARDAGRPYPEDAVRAAGILMRRDYDPSPEEWDGLISAHAKLARKFERREQLVLEHEVAAPDPSLIGRRRQD